MSIGVSPHRDARPAAVASAASISPALLRSKASISSPVAGFTERKRATAVTMRAMVRPSHASCGHYRHSREVIRQRPTLRVDEIADRIEERAALRIGQPHVITVGGDVVEPARPVVHGIPRVGPRLDRRVPAAPLERREPVAAIHRHRPERRRGPGDGGSNAVVDGFERCVGRRDRAGRRFQKAARCPPPRKTSAAFAAPMIGVDPVPRLPRDDEVEHACPARPTPRRCPARR